MKHVITAAVFLTTCAICAAIAQPYRGDGRGNTIPMRDGSTIVTVGGDCLVQYGARRERINNAQRCNDNDIRQADQIMSGGGGGRPGYNDGPGFGGGPGYGGGYGNGNGPGGNWAQTCRGGEMRGSTFRTECRTADGRWNSTVLDMRDCSTNNAENRNGSLVCR